MVLMGQQLIGKPVMSLRSGRPVGRVVDIVVNPHNLKIEGWFVDSPHSKHRLILLSQDIRDIIAQGFVVDDHEALTDPAELIRLEPILKIKFELIGKPVVSASHKHFGKVNDYAFEKDTSFIQKLYMSQPLVKSFATGSSFVNRTQITEVNNQKIIVTDATIPSRALSLSARRAATSPAQS